MGATSVVSVRRYLLMLAGVVALALACMLGITLYSDYQSALTQERARLTTLSQLIADNANGVLERNHARLTRLSKRHAIRAMDASACDHILSDFVELFPEFANLTTIELSGRVPCSAVPQPGGKPLSVAHTEWFKRAQNEKKFVVGNPFIGPITGRLVSVLVEPVWSDEQELLGYLGLPLDLQRFSLQIPAQSLPEGTRFGLLAGDGTLIWRNADPEKLIGKNIGALPGPKAALELRDGQYESFGTDGVNRYTAVASIAQANWVAFINVPMETIRAKVRQSAIRNALVGLAAMIALAILLAYLFRRINLVEEDLLRARDAAEAASRAKSTFLSNMSHELRTPMNGIIGMTELALRHATDPKLIDQLGKVGKASQHLLQLINDILDISKIEAGHLVLEQVSFRLGEILENLLSLIGQRAREKGLQLRVDLAPELAPLALLGDPLRLGQILLNLTGNAVKFTETGSVIVSIRLVENNPADVLLRFEVQDSGIGIDESSRRRLFSAFEQADASMTRKYGGTGLGLAISKRLVQMMDGEIGVDSVVGEGSHFWFVVRLLKATEASAATVFNGDVAEARIRAAYAGSRILLAEDEPINQEVSRGLLEDVGLQVDLAEDGVQAVALARQNAYALILMDMQMPNLNGIEATRQIRLLPGYARTPILALTANAFGEDRQICVDAGMNDHVAKPVDPKKLFKTLLEWLENPPR